MTSRARHHQETQGYLLHTLAWRETSLIIEVFTEQHGRLALIARGVRRPRALLRGVLQPFQRLQLAWFGQETSLRTLKTAEWLDSLPLLRGKALFCGFYLNELLYRLLPPDEPHGSLFLAYGDALRQLSEGKGAEPILRAFEYHLLHALGVAPTAVLATVNQEPLLPETWYQLDHDGAVVRQAEHGEPVSFHGKTLQDMVSGCYEDPRTLQESKALMRRLINIHLGGKEIYTRRILQEIPAL